MGFAKLRSIRKEYCPTPALVLFALAAISVALHIVSEQSQAFSDFFNRYISSFVRAVLALLTCFLPFSLAETVIISIPLFLVAVVAECNHRANISKRCGIRFLVSMAAVTSLLYTLFVVTTIVAYNGTSLASKLDLDERPVSADELQITAEYMIGEMEQSLDAITFRPDGTSAMPYSFAEMDSLLREAYDRAADKYQFIPRLVSRLKPIALSEPMTYTHIAGIYTYYTGEVNININFPDYTLPYTAAHEMAHQRGILPEDEANFVAFLVCMESDDPYIRYSALANMCQYVNSALSRADYSKFVSVYMKLDPRVQSEMTAYNRFFEKYRDNKAAEITSALNDGYLKLQGEESGEKSYGLVVDLAVAYVISLDE